MYRIVTLKLLELLFGEPEVLISARNLCNGTTIFTEPCDEVAYFHLLFDTHEIIYANGCLSESFRPADHGLSAVGAQACREIYALFPELRENPDSFGDTARPVLKGYEAAVQRA